MSTESAAVAAPPAATPSLTSVFVRLKLTLLRNGLRRSTGRTLAYVASVVVGLLFASGVVVGLTALRGNAHVGALVVLLTGILTLGWAAMPLFFPASDETLDPTRLVMLPLRPRPLIVSLLVTSLVGIGPVVTLAFVTGSVIAVADGAASVAVGVVAVILVVLVCVSLARAVATASVRLLTSRMGPRSRRAERSVHRHRRPGRQYRRPEAGAVGRPGRTGAAGRHPALDTAGLGGGRRRRRRTRGLRAGAGRAWG